MTDILMVSNMMPFIQEALDRTYTVHRLYDASDPNALLKEVGGRIRGVATMGTADAALIDALPNLEIISSFGVGFEGVDAAHATKRGVIVTNTPNVLDDDVANLAVMLLLATSRRFVEWDRYAREGRWAQEGDPPLARSIRGRQVGILGLGRIGKNIAGKLEAFGCTIAYHGRHRQDDQTYRFYDDLVNMAQDSDILIAVCPGGEATRGIVNAQVLEALGPDGTFINIARGSVHDEDALVAALQSGRLGAAGLDVFANEPLIPEALRAMPNVVVQPHQGSATQETREAMGQLVIDNLAAHFAGKPPLTPVAEARLMLTDDH